jgi:hypothetical protein
MHEVKLLNGDVVKGIGLRQYFKGNMLYADKRIVVTDKGFNEIEGVDVIELVLGIPNPLKLKDDIKV